MQFYFEGATETVSKIVIIGSIKLTFNFNFFVDLDAEQRYKFSIVQTSRE